MELITYRFQCLVYFLFQLHDIGRYYFLTHLGPLHMSPVDRAGPVSEISVFPTEISVSGLEILPYEHFIPVTGMNGGMNSGGPDGIVLHCLLYFPHHKHPI